MDVTLKDIAKASGVSISTVSRILNKDSSRKSSEETCRRVVQVARELGYISEYQSKAQQLYVDSGQGPLSIGCILTSDYESFVSPFFSTLLAGIQNELARQGGELAYHFFVTNIKDPGFRQFIDSSKLDCAIMLGRTSIENILLLRERIPNLVYAGVNEVGNELDEVLCDAHAGAMSAVRYLAGLGHKRIGFLGPTIQKDPAFNEHRYKGFRDGMAVCGLAIDQEVVLDTLLTSADGYESMAAMIEGKRLPTALFCANDTVALGAMRALGEGGIAVPDDISIVGFDNIDTASYVKPALSTIAVPTKELGRLAVKVMLDKHETGRDYPIRISLPFKLIERESCRAV